MWDRCVFRALVTVALIAAPTAGARGGEDADPTLLLQQQAQLLEQLQLELEHVREEQLRSDDRVRLLEDQLLAQEPVAVSTFGVSEYEAYEMTPENRLFLSGYGVASYADDQSDSGDWHSNFNPVFHFRLSDRLHFIGELEIGLERSSDGSSETDVGLELAQIDFIANDWLTASAGKMFLPFNTFGPRLHPQWINKMASAPPIYSGHGSSGLVPILSEVGFMLSGGRSIWGEQSKINYALFASNGPNFAGHGHGGADHASNGGHDDSGDHGDEGDHSEEPGDHGDEGERHDEPAEHEEEGEHHDEPAEHEEGEHHDEPAALLTGSNTSPGSIDDVAFGGRVGVLPIPRLELGMSFMSGRAGGSEDRFAMLGFDAWYSYAGFELRGEFARLNRTRGFTIPDGYGYYFQLAYRNRDWIADPGFRGMLSRLEPVVRYGEVEDAKQLNLDQFAVGLNYWLYDSVPLKLAYEFNDGADDHNRFVVQFAYGF